MPERTKPGTAIADTIRISLRYAPIPFLGLALSGLFSGAVVPISIFARAKVFDGAIAIASGESSFASFAPSLVLLAFSMLFPSVLNSLKW